MAVLTSENRGQKKEPGKPRSDGRRAEDNGQHTPGIGQLLSNT